MKRFILAFYFILYVLLGSAQNVLIDAKNIDDPIRIKPFSVHRGKYSGKIKYALNGMLNIDKEKRWDLDNTYKYFSKLFKEYAKDDLELNGKQ